MNRWRQSKTTVYIFGVSLWWLKIGDSFEVSNICILGDKTFSYISRERQDDLDSIGTQWRNGSTNPSAHIILFAIYTDIIENFLPSDNNLTFYYIYLLFLSYYQLVLKMEIYLCYLVNDILRANWLPFTRIISWGLYKCKYWILPHTACTWYNKFGT